MDRQRKTNTILPLHISGVETLDQKLCPCRGNMIIEARCSDAHRSDVKETHRRHRKPCVLAKKASCFDVNWSFQTRIHQLHSGHHYRYRTGHQHHHPRCSDYKRMSVHDVYCPDREHSMSEELARLRLVTNEAHFLLIHSIDTILVGRRSANADRWSNRLEC